MRPNEREQRESEARQWQADYDWKCRVSETRRAIREKQTWSNAHPDNVRGRIRELQELLREANY